MHCDLYSNEDPQERTEQNVKEEKLLSNKIDKNFPDKHKSSEFLEVQENRKMFNMSAEKYIKQEQWNPWDVSSIFEFNYFCCPECDFKIQSDEHTETKQEFVDHASSNHPWVSFNFKILRLLLGYEQCFSPTSSFFKNK
jgi:hypothetical protein